MLLSVEDKLTKYPHKVVAGKKMLLCEVKIIYNNMFIDKHIF